MVELVVELVVVAVVSATPDVVPVTDPIVRPRPPVVALPALAPPLEDVLVVVAPLVEVAVAPPAPLDVDVVAEVDVAFSELEGDDPLSEQAATADSAQAPTTTSKTRLLIAAMLTQRPGLGARGCMRTGAVTFYEK